DECRGSDRQNFRNDDSRDGHQRQTDEWLTRRTEQFHAIAVFAYASLQSQASTYLRGNRSIEPQQHGIDSRLWRVRENHPHGCSPQRCTSGKPGLFCFVQDLFAEQPNVEAIDSAAPLATRMRPRSLDEFVGQEHILAPCNRSGSSALGHFLWAAR